MEILFSQLFIWLYFMAHTWCYICLYTRTVSAVFWSNTRSAYCASLGAACHNLGPVPRSTNLQGMRRVELTTFWDPAEKQVLELFELVLTTRGVIKSVLLRAIDLRHSYVQSRHIRELNSSRCRCRWSAHQRNFHWVVPALSETSTYYSFQVLLHFRYIQPLALVSTMAAYPHCRI